MDLSFRILVEACGHNSIANTVKVDEQLKTKASIDAQVEYMRNALAVMRASVQEGLAPEMRSLSGRVGGQAARLLTNVDHAPSGSLTARAGAYALAVAESNACMGKIVAAPTAGACGILPGALFALAEERGLPEDALVDALFTAGAIGRIIAKRASISGAQGGCQAEVGTASAMTAAAVCELLGGTAQQAVDAAAFAIMNCLGLVCDPVDGLVEIPCVYRNVSGVAIALTAADLTLAGIRCPLDADDVADQMRAVGDSMPTSLRETGEAGCAACKVCAR